MMSKWYRGYICAAIVMLIPALVRMSSAPTIIDADILLSGQYRSVG